MKLKRKFRKHIAHGRGRLVLVMGVCALVLTGMGSVLAQIQGLGHSVSADRVLVVAYRNNTISNPELVREMRDILSKSPDKVRSFSQDMIKGALGRPEMERREAGALVWQYRTRQCVWDIFFTPEDAKGSQGEKPAWHVAHHDLRRRHNLSLARRGRLELAPDTDDRAIGQGKGRDSLAVRCITDILNQRYEAVIKPEYAGL